MGESVLQNLIIRCLVSSLEEWARAQGLRDIFIGADQFFAWVENHPMVRVSPDVYLLRNPPDPLPASFQTWRPDHRAPDVAFEVVSQDWRKDYLEGPEKYAQLGCPELWIFDPLADGPERVALQNYLRQDDGAFVRVAYGGSPLYSPELDLWVVPIGTGPNARLRLSPTASADILLPTTEEALAAAHTEIERLRRLLGSDPT